MSIALLPLVIVLGFIAFVIFMSIMFEAASGWIKRYRHHARVQQARRELYSLTDLNLRDIGITRGDVSRIAREGSDEADRRGEAVQPPSKCVWRDSSSRAEGL